MFETLTGRLQTVFRNLGRRGKLRLEDIDSALGEIRLALLDADVHYQVVTNLLGTVRARAMGEDISRSLNPSRQVIGIIQDELVSILGEPGRLSLVGARPRTIMLVGLHGSGKTTTAAKLARLLRGRGERVMLVAADPHRPAGVEQLKILGEEIDVPVFSRRQLTPPELSVVGIEAAAKDGTSVAILDTAGRSQLDQTLMDELKAIQNRVDPVEVLLVADAMMGQEAVRIAEGFQESISLTGMILTKMDGDARGGAAISMRAVTGVPIKFIGVGEARDALDVFEPSRLASRILGMGDVVGLIEKAEGAFEQEQAARILQGEFTLEDFSEQLAMMRNMGPLGKLLEMLPANFGGVELNLDGETAEHQLVRTQAIIYSMTPNERRKPNLINARRKRRIASGSGTSVQEINLLLRQYKKMRRMFKKMGNSVPKGIISGR